MGRARLRGEWDPCQAGGRSGAWSTAQGPGLHQPAGGAGLGCFRAAWEKHCARSCPGGGASLQMPPQHPEPPPPGSGSNQFCRKSLCPQPFPRLRKTPEGARGRIAGVRKMHGLLEQLPSGSRMKLNIWPPLWPTHLCNPRVSTRVRA